MIRAAGILIVSGGEILYLKRGPNCTLPGVWCFPGGHVEDGETSAEAAVRETFEETGIVVPPDAITEWTRTIIDDVDFTTYIAALQERPESLALQADEVDDYTWAPLNSPPDPLHPGIRIALARFAMDELSVAKAMAAGQLASPSVYQNLTLFNIRITGTGLAYRIGHEEFVWRQPDLYLNDRFLQRCNGLPVIWEHPKGTVIDSDEFERRIVGTIFYPYIPTDKPEDVWGISKIYDAAAINELITRPYSTSPSVTLRKGANAMGELDGEALLIEGAPALVDHLALCEHGVWDKGGPPDGVESADIIRADSIEHPLPRNSAPDMHRSSLAASAAFALAVAVATRGTF
jgi:8-oxo-dGTP pyrophosphatase MutT (NUDIX family)